MELVEEKWDEILDTLKAEYDIKEMLFNTWLKPLKVGSVTDSTLTLIYPIKTSLATNKDFVVKYITEHYGLQLNMVVSDITGKSYEISIDVQSEEDSDGADERPAFATSQNYAASHLNEKFTFETFVVGSTNRFAQQASLAVADSPGKFYNPLYIYGGPGLGKTHLIHAIGNYILQEDPTKKVLYVTSEEFTNEVIDSMRNANVNAKSMSNFRDKYRMVDVLLIDDIQFIIGKESTQEEFFHTFNTLYQAGKQIVLTSDKSPKEMETLEERIRTRFEMGLMADIGYPEYELRMAILRKKVDEDAVEISDEILNYIASNIKSNVREL
ncbi:MAG: chromosomal replication initiator protein DnaA, partial [Lachnospiraceae bacterium]|nr:chromosomal replication initiator protein DnaA [Lachnospiraceae bacterium]